MPDRIKEQLTDYATAATRDHRRARARQAKRVDEVIADVMLRRGYGRTISREKLQQAWREAAGSTFADLTVAGEIRRGRLEVIADCSTTVQELTFHREEILGRLVRLLPGESIQDIRVRVGPVT